MNEIIETIKEVNEECKKKGIMGISRRRYVYNVALHLIGVKQLTKAEETAIIEVLREVVTK